jgi:hypothetical protein
MKTASLACVVVFALALSCFAPSRATATDALPEHLGDTGFPVGNVRGSALDLMSFTPQYPLWSDGAEKRRWLYLPPGSFIDASRPDAWEFPRGTRLWKEFAYGGRRVETRYIERLADGSWRFAAYVWNEAGSDARLAPERGATVPVAEAPLGRHEVPGRYDCLACHASTAVPVLGASALQLSPDHDPLAAGVRASRDGDVDVPKLVASGRLRGLPAGLLKRPPRISAATPVERAALGYLHANCAHCHNTSDARVPVQLTLAQRAADPDASRAEVLASAVDAISRYRPPGADADAHVIVAGRPEASVLVQRMASRRADVQMPPLGTQVPDPEGLALVHRWIAGELNFRKEQRQ